MQNHCTAVLFLVSFDIFTKFGVFINFIQMPGQKHRSNMARVSLSGFSVVERHQTINLLAEARHTFPLIPGLKLGQ
jgi:hypothetical protein